MAHEGNNQHNRNGQGDIKIQTENGYVDTSTRRCQPISNTKEVSNGITPQAKEKTDKQNEKDNDMNDRCPH
jgi:hypothetical protein